MTLQLKPTLKRLLLAGLLLAACLWLADLLLPLNLPDERQQGAARVVVDAAGRPLRSFADSNGVWRYPITLEEVSPLYIEALLNYEDRWFWYHPGINLQALLRATVQNIRNGRIVSGGSTLSMQVARLLHPHSRTIAGKLKQILRTLQLEWHLNKRQILTLYLNLAPFGGTLEGVQAASYTYLNKPASELSDAEAALLAVLPQSPTRFRPDIHPQAASLARDKVLDRLVTLGVWSQERVEAAKIEQVVAQRAHHLQLAPLLSRRLLSEQPKQRIIATTIDGALQSALEDYVANYVERLPMGTSAAVLVVDNQTAEVKAYLGSAIFADQQRFGHVDMVTARRSPGSTLKPFLFGLAMQQGLIHSHSLLADVPRHWADYRPQNYSGAFSGPVSASAALQRSLNVPFVDLLARYGSERFVGNLASAGLMLDIPDGKANLTVILGGAATSLEELVSSYTALARNGKAAQLKYLAEDHQKTINERYLMDPSSAWVTYQTLAQIPRPGSLNTLAATQERQSIAWKTGTSYGFRDSWAIGVSPQYTIGIWVGRPDGTSLPGYNGRQTAAPLLFAVSDHLQPQTKPLPKPDNVVQQQICWPLGTLANAISQTETQTQASPEFCQQKHLAWIINDTVPATWHAADAGGWQSNPFPYWINPDSGLQVNAHCQTTKRQQKWLALWPKVLEPWLSYRQKKAGQLSALDPSCQKTLLSPSSTLQIIGIADNSIYRSTGPDQPSPELPLRAIGGSGRYYWYINGQYQYSANNGQSVIHRLQHKGQQQLLVMDDVGNVDKLTVNMQ